MTKNIHILRLSEVNKDEWNGYAMCHAHGNIFQHTAYLDCHVAKFKSEQFGFAAYESDKLVGLVGGIILYNYFYPLSIITRRAVIEGGPLADNDDVANVLLKSVTDYTKRKAVYTQFRNLWDMGEENGLFKQNGFAYEPHLDFIHDLTVGEDVILSQINKNKRANVRKSLNKGMMFCEAGNEDLVRCVDLIQGTYKRVGLPCQSRDYFYSAMQSLKGIAKVFVAKYEDVIVGTRIELCFKEVVYDWFAGSDDNYKNLYPNDFIPYHILLWGAANGYKKFDFGGAGKPGVPYGVREHKAKFGGELVEFGRYERVNKKLFMAIGKFGLSLTKRK